MAVYNFYNLITIDACNFLSQIHISDEMIRIIYLSDSRIIMSHHNDLPISPRTDGVIVRIHFKSMGYMTG